MKVIIIQDSDGHVQAFEYSLSNLFSLLRWLLKENKMNTILENEDEAKALLVNSSTTESSIENWVLFNGPTGRSGGNIVNIVTVHSQL